MPSVGTTDEEVFRVEEKQLDSLPITSKEIWNATRADPILSRILQFLKCGWPISIQDDRLKPFYNRRYELTVEQDCILWGLRVVIPKRYQAPILEELHISHPGIVRMKEIARSFVWWPNCDKDIEVTVRNCSNCQQVKSVPAVSPLTPWSWPARPWTRVHIDYAEHGKQHFLIVVDAHSHWPEIFSMQSTTSEATITVMRDLFSKYGIPTQVVSDNGPQFCSAEFENFLKKNGVKHVRVSPYHAASNGLAERMVQSFKRSYHSSKQDKISTHQSIANFLLTYRSTTHPTTGYTPAKLFLGRELRTKLSLIKPDAQSTVIKAQGNQKDYHDLHAKYREFYPGDAVLIKDLRKEKTWWPGTVVERSALKSYVTVLADGQVWKRHVDHLRRSNPHSEELPGQLAGPKDSGGPKNSDEGNDDDAATIQEEEEQEHVPSAAQEQTSNNHTPNRNEEAGPSRSTPDRIDDPSMHVNSPNGCRRSSRKCKPPDRLIESM